MPKEGREVTEYFILNRTLELIYHQNYRAKHFAEGLMMNIVRKKPLDHGGFILRTKKDFTRLSYASVSSLHEAIASGAIYEIIAENMERNLRSRIKWTSA